jgi:hypothetical protein
MENIKNMGINYPYISQPKVCVGNKYPLLAGGRIFGF